MKTKISNFQMERVQRSCGFLSGIDVSAEGSRGGLSLAWKGTISISLQSYTIRHIDVEVEEKDLSIKWFFTGFSGSLYVTNIEES